MPKGTTLLSGLSQKRRELEQAIETVDAAIRLVQGKRTAGGRGKARGPMSEETKAKLRASHARRKRQAQAHSQSQQPKPKAARKLRRTVGVRTERTRPRMEEQAMEAEA